MLLALPLKLLVIDQDSLGERFLNLLSPHHRYQVTEINSSCEAIQTTEVVNPDVIIINLLQPESNSWKLCYKLRESCQSPILVLSAVSSPQSIARWLDAGADDYLIKPISPAILHAHLQKLARRSYH